MVSKAAPPSVSQKSAGWMKYMMAMKIVANGRSSSPKTTFEAMRPRSDAMSRKGCATAAAILAAANDRAQRKVAQSDVESGGGAIGDHPAHDLGQAKHHQRKGDNQRQEQ